MNRLLITIIAILATLAQPAWAQFPESRLRVMVQPSYWSAVGISGILGLEGEFHLPGTAWSMGAAHSMYVSHSKLVPRDGQADTNQYGTSWQKPKDGPVLFGRYSVSPSFSWLIGMGAFEYSTSSLIDIPEATRPVRAWQGGGVVLGLAYRPSLGPFWLQVAPNMVLGDILVASDVDSEQKLWSITKYSQSGLAWLEVGVRLWNFDLAVDPVSRSVRTSWIF